MTQYTEQEQAQLLTLTSIIADSWSRVTDLKSLIASLTTETPEVDNNTFNRAKVVDAFQDLVDAYLVCIGQLESALDKADFITDEAEESDSKEDDEEDSVKEEDATNDEAEEATEDNSDDALATIADELDVCVTDDAVIIAKKDEIDDEDAPKIEISRQHEDSKGEDEADEEPAGPWSYWVDFD